MKPIDKFGRPIYGKTWHLIKYFGEKLKRAGWVEVGDKPNLFLRRFDEVDDVVVFADMRGTEEVPIWEAPYPLLYTSKGEDWKRRKAIKLAGKELDSLGIPWRLSWFDENEPDGLFFGSWEELPDGFCKMCGVELHDASLFCSEHCRKCFEQLEELRREMLEATTDEKCIVCGKPLDLTHQVKHHISYSPEKVVTVCRSCHVKIHLNHEKYPDLAPSQPPLFRKKLKKMWDEYVKREDGKIWGDETQDHEAQQHLY
jgi:hypothetical protein